MRVCTVAIRHKTNTFVREPTTFQDFHVFRGPSEIAGSKSGESLAGFGQGLCLAQIECIPAFHALAHAGGTISAEAFSELTSEVLKQLAACQPFDGLLVDLSGAAASEVALDGDGAWLTAIRSMVGKVVTIVATVGRQANLSPASVQATNAILLPRPSEHPSQCDIHREAAELLSRSLRGEIKLTQSAAWPDVVISNDRQSPEEPAGVDLFARVRQELDQRHVLAGGIALGFPYTDTPHLGPSVVVVTDNAPLLAKRSADNLAHYVVQRRMSFQSAAITIDQAIARIKTSAELFALLDTGDSVPDGSPGNGTLLLLALMKSRAASTLVHIVDAAAVDQCRRAGRDQGLELTIGAEADWRLGEALQAVGTVQSLFAHPFIEHNLPAAIDAEKRNSAAVVQLESGPTVLITAERWSTTEAWASYGIDAEAFRVLVAKQAHLSTEANSRERRTILGVSTPGPTTIDLGELAYHRRRRPMYPFEEL